MLKKLIAIGICFLASAAIVLLLPLAMQSFQGVQVKESNASDDGKFNQHITYVHDEPHKVYKIYESGKLLGVLNHKDKLDQHLKDVYKEKYEEKYPGTSAHLDRDVYVTDEYSYYDWNDVDEKILKYLDDHNLYTLEATQVTFSTDDQVEAQIYVSDEKLYEDAMNEYISYFIDPDALAALNNADTIPSLSSYGSQDVGISIAQTITTDKADASPDEIKTTKDEILEYLEYGDNTDREYYTVKAYDTVAGVGAKNYGLSAAQVMNINRDKIKSTDQVLTEGEKLCVTYFESPLDIVVYKERLKAETVYYDTYYSEDNTLLRGQSQVIQNGSDGSRNVLYREKWINGVLTSGSQESSVETKQPVDEVVAVGSKQVPGVGTGEFRFPVDNAAISCPWGCYYGHRGTDFIDVYNSWGDVYAADSGTVIVNSYNSVNGNYVKIDHGNGWVSYYGHMREPSDLAVGTIVEKGQVIGHIGMTGAATGPHTHFFLEYNGERKDACSVDIFPDCSGIIQ